MWKRNCIYLAVGLLLIGRPVLAHHAFSADFDRAKPVTLDGTVTKVEWTNPHGYLFVDVKDASGTVTNWKVELGSRDELTSKGWTQQTLTPGTHVNVRGWRAKNSAGFANADTITMDSGTKLTAASSYYGDSQTTGTSGTLPQTASPLALIGLIGLLATGAAVGLRSLRR